MFNKKKSKTNEPLFFLFTCVKDGRKYINKLFESLLAQTKINFVHYIYEDGSKDPLDEMVEQYKEKASRLLNPYEIIYEKNPVNIGLNMATKHCIDRCFCPYFIWIDCDNWVDKDFFSELGKAVNKHKQSKLFRTKCNQISSKGLLIDQTLNPHFKESLKKGYCKWRYFFRGHKKYYYSFFALNTNYYKEKMAFDFENNRLIFNDDQILSHYYATRDSAVFVNKSIGYQLIRADSEAATISLEQNEKAKDVYVEYNRNIFESYGRYNSSIFEHYNYASTLFYQIFKEYSAFNNREGFKLLESTIVYCFKNNVNVCRFITIREFLIYLFKYLLKYKGNYKAK